MGHYFAVSENEMSFAATGHHTKWRQTERQLPHDMIYMQNPKNGTNELNHKTETGS